MYTLHQLKEILKEGDSGFIADFDFYVLDEIVRSWEEDIKAVTYKSYITTDYNATKMK